MLTFFDNGNTIIWPNGYAASYTPDVYAALKAYNANPNDPSVQWIKDTYVRESWVAFNYLVAATSDAAASKVAKAVATPVIDYDKLAKAVIAATPPMDYAALAKAVNDDAAKRLAN